MTFDLIAVNATQNHTKSRQIRRADKFNGWTDQLYVQNSSY